MRRLRCEVDVEASDGGGPSQPGERAAVQFVWVVYERPEPKAGGVIVCLSCCGAATVPRQGGPALRVLQQFADSEPAARFPLDFHRTTADAAGKIRGAEEHGFREVRVRVARPITDTETLIAIFERTLEQSWLLRWGRGDGPYPGVVYFIQSGRKNGPIKIGYTNQIDKRLGYMQSGNPYELVLLGSVPGDRDLETSFHRWFEPWRIRGEWFSVRGSGLRDVALHAGTPRKKRSYERQWPLETQVAA